MGIKLILVLMAVVYFWLVGVTRVPQQERRQGIEPSDEALKDIVGITDNDDSEN